MAKENSPENRSTISFKNFLSKSTLPELQELVSYLYKNDAFAKNYIGTLLNPASERELHAKARKIIIHEFYPSRGFNGKLRFSLIKKSIADFRKMCNEPAKYIDLMLVCVEKAVMFTQDFGDINAQFYLSTERMYEASLKEITQLGLDEDFKERCRKIMVDGQGIGWGFSDALGDLFHDYFAD